MCGICIWVRRRGGVDGNRLAEAAELLRHRGPDARNVFLWERGGRNPLHWGRENPRSGAEYDVGLAHARLSIIDLTDGGSQPMADAATGAGIVFNGEIYNYIELAAELAEGSLRTRSDTEVLLRHLLAQGPECLRRMNGMWAFALHRPDRRELLLGRDRYGKKPLFYYHGENDFIAASEYRAIFHILGVRRKLNPEFLFGFLSGKRIPTFEDGSSLYEGIRSLPAGCAMRFDLERHEPEIMRNNGIESFLAETPDPEALQGEIASAVELRLRSDVPVAVMVSGGVDSTMVAACIARNKAAKENVSFYTLDVNDPDDLRYSKELADALGIRLIEVPSRVDDAMFTETFNAIVRHYEAPVSFGLVALPGWLVCRKIAEDGNRVVLDGTGGDEVLGGYSPYFTLAMQELMRRRRMLPAMRLKRLTDEREGPEGAFKQVGSWWKFLRRSVFPKRGFRTKAEERAGFLLRHCNRVGADAAAEIVRQAYSRDRLADPTEYQIFDLLRGQMPSYLWMNDHNSMAHSIELRSPLLDYRLAKYVHLPMEYKYRNGFNKYHLRASLPDNVPDSVRWRKGKAGFGLMPPNFLERNEKRFRAAVLESALLRELFDMPSLVREMDEARKHWKLKSLPQQLYALALFEEHYPDVQI
ncbi:asparagine synthase (glutamine-hydrolyzing) [Paucidesulfovibrio longus]|uniref:asparagine synthase (glutamine-hydrolyzing) n=1 Tax=Paucidesulfovibrio longus TaxID=889 RepID=UPI0003B474CC|nr:asparagine synthase (glutamine-hydrolyzing) [Paucidesulfovibrio longus]